MAEEKTTNKENVQPLGISAVNHLYKLYLGRDASQEELDMYKNHPDDSILRKDLEFARKTALEDNQKKEEQLKQQEAAKIIGTEEPEFGGEQTLVKFTSDPDGPGPQTTRTIYLVDQNTKEMRPFLSEAAFNARYGKTPEEATTEGLITSIPMSSIAEGGTFSGFKLLKDVQGIRDDGTFEETEPALSPDKIRRRYGKERNIDLEKDVLNGVLSGFFKAIKTDPATGLSAEFVDGISSDENIIGSYINAIAYGGYHVNDIYRDLKRRKLVDEGRTDLKGIKVIDEGINASEFYNTPTGRVVRTNPELTPPQYIGEIDTGLLENPVFNIPAEAYEILSPPLDFTSPEGQAELDKIKSVYHDVLLRSLEAKTEQEKARADYEYGQFQKELERKYGIALSDSATEAWGQLATLGERAAGRGLYGSGIHREMREKMLSAKRKADERLREQRLTTEEEAKRQHLIKYGSPEEIQALSEEEKVKYGFKTDPETAQFFSMENLRATYPEATEEDLRLLRGSMVDQFGNIKSEMQQKLFSNKFLIEKGMQFGAIAEGEEEYKMRKVAEEKLAEEEKAFKPFVKGLPFEKYRPEEVEEEVVTEEVVPPVEEKKVTEVPEVTKPVEPWKTPEGFEKIHRPEDIFRYQDVVTKPGTVEKFGKKVASPFGEGFERISGPSRIPEYTDVKPDPTGKTRHLYGKPIKT